MDNTLIEVSDISKRYGKVTALKNVSFKVMKGEVIGYLGPNGSGKTTTIRVLTGLCNANGGSVSILGNDIVKNYEKLEGAISVVLENHGTYQNLSAWENLEFFARLSGVPKNKRKELIEESLTLAGLTQRKKSLVKTFSKGMLQKLAIARAMIINPKILILDEPFDGVDVESRFSIINMLKKWIKDEERCIFLTSHNMADIEELCNRIVILRSGEIIWSGLVDDLQKGSGTQKIEIVLSQESSISDIRKAFSTVKDIMCIQCENTHVMLEVKKGIKSSLIAEILNENKLKFEEIHVKREDLSDVYLRMVKA